MSNLLVGMEWLLKWAVDANTTGGICEDACSLHDPNSIFTKLTAIVWWQVFVVHLHAAAQFRMVNAGRYQTWKQIVVVAGIIRLWFMQSSTDCRLKEGNCLIEKSKRSSCKSYRWSHWRFAEQSLVVFELSIPFFCFRICIFIGGQVSVPTSYNIPIELSILQVRSFECKYLSLQTLEISLEQYRKSIYINRNAKRKCKQTEISAFLLINSESSLRLSIALVFVDDFDVIFINVDGLWTA